MDIKHQAVGLIFALLISSIATAGSMSTIHYFQDLHRVVSLEGGYAAINVSGSKQSFVGTDSNVFTYTNSNKSKNSGFIGVLLAAEKDLSFLSHPEFFFQIGAEYNYFSTVSVNGVNGVGIEPQISTIYSYTYDFQVQQVVGVLKLFKNMHKRINPYAEVGLGVSINHLGQYNAVTTENGSINLTPKFNNGNQTEFSYNLGVGIDTLVKTNIRVGLGYRYSNFGSVSFKNGFIAINNYQSFVPFALKNSNAYANQLVAHISYLA